MDRRVEKFVEENIDLAEEVRQDGVMSEYAANQYAAWLVETGRMSRFDAAQEKRKRSIRDR
jgi:hypothetical protein